MCALRQTGAHQPSEFNNHQSAISLARLPFRNLTHSPQILVSKDSSRLKISAIVPQTQETPRFSLRPPRLCVSLSLRPRARQPPHRHRGRERAGGRPGPRPGHTPHLPRPHETRSRILRHHQPPCCSGASMAVALSAASERFMLGPRSSFSAFQHFSFQLLPKRGQGQRQGRDGGFGDVDGVRNHG